MDILYIIGDGYSKCNHNELRYSLRSIDEHGQNVGRVFVAGFCPEWLSDDVVKVPYVQPYAKEDGADDGNLAKKAGNIISTLLHVIDKTDIGEEFLVSMDDHIYIKDVDFSNYPFFCKKYGTDNCLPEKGKSIYQKFLAGTRVRLENDGLSYFYLCPHRNMHVSRTVVSECRGLLETAASIPLPLESWAYMLNYRYSVHKDFDITVVNDVKLFGGKDWWMVDPDKTDVISTGDFEPGIGLDCLLKGMFNKKSKYEL